MNAEEVAERLRFEWSGEGGFLYGLRRGHFDSSEAARFLSVLDSIDITDASRFDPSIAGRLWVIPYYMLSHIHNSESLGLDTSEARRVLYRANDILAGVFGGRADEE